MSSAKELEKVNDLLRIECETFSKSLVAATEAIDQYKLSEGNYANVEEEDKIGVFVVNHSDETKAILLIKK